MSAETGEILVTFMGLLVFYNRPFVTHTSPLCTDDCFDAQAYAKQTHPSRRDARMCIEEIEEEADSVCVSVQA